MEIVLLERVESLGQMGDVVKVRAGYARNFLLPQKKALRATNSNLEYFQKRKSELEALNAKRRGEAETISKKLDGLKVVIVRQASEGGQLYGSVSARDIADSIIAAGYTVERRQVILNQAIKMLGLFPIKVSLHPEVTLTVTANIARSEEEAKLQEQRGEAVIHRDTQEEPEEVAATPQPEAPAEPEAAAETA